MHLTDQQLIEDDYDENIHFSQCQPCQQRLEHLLVIRQQLLDIVPPDHQIDQWQSIKQDFLSQHQPPSSNKKKLNFWRLTSMSLAASLVLFAILLSPPFKDNPSQASDLEVLIAKNNQLQQQLVTLNGQLKLAGIKQLQFQLGQLDAVIQQAYFDQLSDDHKITLWQQRQQLISNTLINQQQSKIVRI